MKTAVVIHNFHDARCIGDLVRKTNERERHILQLGIDDAMEFLPIEIQVKI